jgi:hypothetical protein
MLKSHAFQIEVQNALLVSTGGVPETSNKKRKVSGWTAQNGLYERNDGPLAKKVNVGPSLVQRYKKCTQCAEQFDTNENFGKICERHPGEEFPETYKGFSS